MCFHFLDEVTSPFDIKERVELVSLYGRQYAISQLRIVRSGLHLVTYLDVGNFCDKSTETIYF